MLPQYQRKGWDIDDFFDQRDTLVEDCFSQDEVVTSLAVDGTIIEDIIPSPEDRARVELSGWRYLTDLGREYQQIMKETQSGDTYSNRTLRQRVIVDEAVIKIQPYLHSLAKDLLNGYVKLKGRNVTLRGSRMEEEDLVQDATENVHSVFGKYDPTKSEFSTWVTVVAMRKMLRSAVKNSIISVSDVPHVKGKYLLGLSKSQDDFLSRAEELPFSNRGGTTTFGSERAAMLLLHLNGKYVDIWGPADTGYSPTSSSGTYESRYLPDKKDVSGEEFVAKKELKRDINAALETLRSYHQNTLRERFFEESILRTIGKNNSLTPETIRRREKVALQKLRHPARKLQEHWD